MHLIKWQGVTIMQGALPRTSLEKPGPKDGMTKPFFSSSVVGCFVTDVRRTCKATFKSQCSLRLTPGAHAAFTPLVILLCRLLEASTGSTMQIVAVSTAALLHRPYLI
jgi:hypothetical protein